MIYNSNVHSPEDDNKTWSCSDKLHFLNTCGIFLKKQLETTPKKKPRDLAVIQKWQSLAHHCMKLSNGYSADYQLRPRKFLDSGCPLCESKMKTVSSKNLEEHVCLSDDVVIKVKRIPRDFQGTIMVENFLQRSSSVSPKMKRSQEAHKIEDVLRLRKNARTLGKVLAVEGPEGMIQLLSSAPTIRTKRVEVELRSINVIPNLFPPTQQLKVHLQRILLDLSRFEQVHQKRVNSSDSLKEQSHKRYAYDIRQLEKPESSEQSDNSPAKKTRKTRLF